MVQMQWGGIQGALVPGHQLYLLLLMIKVGRG